MKKLQKGFTLIELLVVIAIIGILASIVLASLSTATSKGNNAKIEEQLSSVRDAAQIYYATYNNYSGSSGSPVTSCSSGMFSDTNSGMANLVTTSSYPSGSSITCKANGSAFYVSATLNGFSWCADSNGNSTSTAGNSTNVACF